MVIAAVPAATAQSIDGELRVAGTGAPFAHAFVILRDTEGKEVARTLTDATGRFTLQATAGRYRLQTARIGWQPWFSPFLALTDGETVRYSGEVVFGAIALSAVVVRGERTCGTAPSAGREIAQVWDEARKALDAVSWTQRSAPLTYEIEVWESRLHGLTLDTLRQEIRQRSTRRAGSPFGSPSAEFLSERGYIRQNDDGDWEYDGPDADVLLSSPFASDHCFFLTYHDDDEELIGLGFEPVRRRRRTPDIEGVMWMKQATAELVSLEFRYANLPWDGVRSPYLGGYIEFASLETGGWIVREWGVRMPILTLHTNRLRWDVRDAYAIAAFEEEGGRVTRVTGPDGSEVQVGR